MKTLSVVATSRNDDHGGNLIHRTQLFVDGLIAQCNRHQLDAELILVEWNPPTDRPPLSQALKWPENTGRCDIRIVQVPEVIHQRIRYAEKLPLFQMIAKNAGIRRARGRFILATNIDILLSDELMAFISAGQLVPGCLYRIDRYDVYGDIPADRGMDGILAYCRKHVLRTNNRYYSRNLDSGLISWTQYPAWPLPYMSFFLYDLRNKRRQGNNVPLWAARYLRYVTVLGIRMVRQIFSHEWIPPLHTNACGDFTLMDADSWKSLRGYWEWEGFSMHLDSHLLYAAYLAGIRQKILKEPMRIYHIEHDMGSGYTPEGKDTLYERISKAGIPMLDMDQLRNRFAGLRREGKRLIYNTKDWGLASVDLPETRIGSQ